MTIRTYEVYLIAIVGPNPRWQDVKQDTPFAGDAGKLLSACLRQAGIDEADVYFTHAVKETTEKNKEPSAALAKQYREQLITELQEVNPSVIIPLGNFAFKEITGRGGISRAIGMPTTPHPRLGLPTAHVVGANLPMFALRNPGMAEANNVAFRFAYKLATGTAVEPSPRIVWVEKLGTVDAIENVTNKISEAQTLVYDIETNAREFTDPDFTAYLLSIDTGEWNFVFGPSEKSLRMGTVLLGMSKGKKIGHNSIRFDAHGLAVIEPSACKALKHESHDTMLLDYLLDENAASHALEAACHRILCLAPWKRMVTWDWHDTPAAEIPWETAVEYCAKDTAATRMLWEELWPRVRDDEGLHRVYNDILRPASVGFVSIERNGVYVRKDYIEQIKANEFLPAAQQHLTTLREIVGDAKFNPNSPPQIAAYLFTKQNERPVSFTDTGKPSTGEVDLKKIMERGSSSAPFCQAILDYRENVKIIGTYLDSYYSRADEQWRVFPSYGLTTTVTGRTSCFKPNYENIPRDPRVRGIIGARPGMVLLQADYSQLELRIGAFVAGEANMLAAFERNEDLHTNFARFITGKEVVTKEERTAAKVAGFGFLYGADEHTFVEYAFKNYNIHFTFAEAKRIRDAFFAMYPQLDTWYQRCAEELFATGQIRSFIGQIRRLPQIYSEDAQMRLEALRQGINFTVQSPASHLGILAATFLAQFIPQEFENTQVVGFVHDAIHVECPETKVIDVAQAVKRIMEEQVVSYLQQGGVPLSVPLVADIEYGPSWGQMSKLELAKA